MKKSNEYYYVTNEYFGYLCLSRKDLLFNLLIIPGLYKFEKINKEEHYYQRYEYSNDLIKNL